MALYPQPVQAQIGGVEYLPVPRQKEPSQVDQRQRSAAPQDPKRGGGTA